MGHLFSRALRRFTHCSSNSNQSQHQSEEAADAGQQQQLAQQQREQEYKPTVQSIPVGQSIDSSDYAAFEASKQLSTRDRSQEEKENTNETKIKDSADKTISGDDSPSRSNNNSNENTPEVEEAVIKIQAYVRGHLTRKALKDAQHQNTAPQPNALGQSQFDEESLTKNPPGAVFSLSSSLNPNLVNTLEYFNSPLVIDNQSSGKITPKLESIAEETQNSVSLDKKDIPIAADELEQDSEVSKLTSNQQQNLTLSVNLDSRDSVSPVPSEANVSIDLSCETPASVSIDIADHNIKPIEKIASVLHHRVTPVSPLTSEVESEPTVLPSPPRVVEPELNVAARNDTPPPSSALSNDSMMKSNNNSHSIDSAEAAAIRIQSAFRGYHTRKHSPYRRRSPTSTPPLSLDNNQTTSNGTGRAATRVALRQQDATVMDDDEDDEGISGLTHSKDEEISDRLTERGDLETDRRLSRQRQREANLTSEAKSIESNEDQSVLTDQSTIREAMDVHPKDPAPGVDVIRVDDDSENKQAHSQLETTDTLDDSTAALSDALENLTDSLNRNDDGGALVESNQESMTQQRVPRLSLGANSVGSVEVNTESSAIGGALSMNEEAEEKSFGESIVASLLDDYTTADLNQSLNEKQAAAVDEAANMLEAALEEVIDDGSVEDTRVEADVKQGITANSNLDDDEQRAIELSSDDIEKRDPKGCVSEGSSRSRQTKLEQSQPSLASESNVAGDNDQADDLDPPRLDVVSPDEAFSSGPPSPALVPSNNSSDDDDAESEPGQGDNSSEKNQQRQQNNQNNQEPSSSGGNKNKKRNRNKKKGKK